MRKCVRKKNAVYGFLEVSPRRENVESRVYEFVSLFLQNKTETYLHSYLFYRQQQDKNTSISQPPKDEKGNGLKKCEHAF